MYVVASRVLYSKLLVRQGLFAVNDRSILRAFNFPEVQGPAVTKRKMGAIRLCCLGGFQGNCRLLGLNCPLSS